jgi:acetoacetyl-CoA synthetase
LARPKCASPSLSLHPLSHPLTLPLAHSYSVVEKIDTVADCLAVGQKLPDGDERHVLFVKPVKSPLTAAVKDQIKSAIRNNLSTRHVPALIVEVPKVPLTTNGKRLEVPVKKLINGVQYESLNLASAEDPELLRLFVNHPELDLTVKAKL